MCLFVYLCLIVLCLFACTPLFVCFFTCASLFVCLFTCASLFVCVSLRVYISVRLPAFGCVCIVCLCIFLSVCVHVLLLCVYFWMLVYVPSRTCLFVCV